MGAISQPPAIEPEVTDAETRKQRSLAFANIRYHADRLQRIAFPLKAAASPMCQDRQSHESGLQFINRHSFGDHYRETLETEMAATDQLQVMRVIPGSPAAAADIEPGDQFLSLNDQAVPEGPKAPEHLEQMLKDALSQSACKGASKPTLLTCRQCRYAITRSTLNWAMRLTPIPRAALSMSLRG